MHKLLPILVLSLAACAAPCEHHLGNSESESKGLLPGGLYVVEQSPEGYFVRLSSTARVTDSIMLATVEALAGQFDRIDFCIDAAHERGDDYLSVIGSQVFDYDNNRIYSINPLQQ